jgi:UDP-N-acetylmuramoyl-L-alanyl-D-glutamate--2,6-diaminopimelate ligase
LGVLAVSHALGHDLHRVASALKEAPGAPGRFERVAIGPERPHVFVDYAHSDDALEKVLQFLRELRGQGGGRIITVFGCGGDRDRGKRPLMGKVASTWSDVTIATSDNPRTEAPSQIIDDIEPGIRRDRTEYHREENRREAIYLALSLARSEDMVLVAGKGHETYQILATGQIPFDDRAVIREYYGKLEKNCTPGSNSIT